MRLLPVRIWIVAVGAVIVMGMGILYYLRLPAETPLRRGAQLARNLGCFACHGDGGLEGVPNPKGHGEDVPAWNGMMYMMYLKNDDHIREYILYGERRDHEEHHHHGDHEKALIRMPGYKNIISKQELEDLVVYVKAVSEFFPKMPQTVQKGFGTAKQNGCFGCHGPSGFGGRSNPGSFKGSIPGWDGKDFSKSVQDTAELREWIMTGTIKRWEDNPLASYFLRNQQIKMPAYKNVLTPQQIKSIMNYIDWMRSNN